MERTREGSLGRQAYVRRAGRELLREGQLLRHGRGAPKGGERLAGQGCRESGTSGPVERRALRRISEGELLGVRRLGRKELDGSITHRPERDVTLAVAKLVSLLAMVRAGE